MIVRAVFLWIHVLSMAGTFGALLLVQAGLPASLRKDTEVVVNTTRLASLMLAIGLMSGLVVFWQLVRGSVAAGAPVSAHLLGVVGVKFALLVLSGAFVGIGAKRLRTGKGGAAGLRWAAIVALGLAAFMGVTL